MQKLMEIERSGINMRRTIHIPERDFKRSNFTASKPDGKYTINVYDSNLETIEVFRCDGYTIRVK